MLIEHTAQNDKVKHFLDFILAHATGDDRPYVEVNIYGTRILGLLDSGANKTIVGKIGWKIFQNLGHQPKIDQSHSCTVADGNNYKALGTVTVPMTLRNKTKLVECLILPEFPHTLILGVDFWKVMGILPNLFLDTWKFDNPNNLVCSSVEISNTLSEEQRDNLKNLLDKYVKIDPKHIGCCKAVRHKIVLNNDVPIKQRYYPVSPVIQKHINAELDKMLEMGVVEPSTSSWSSPILLIPKKDKSYRFVVDYRKLNQVTKKDAYPLPYVNHILDRLRDAKYISTLDIKSAYLQIPMDEGSKEYTAFTVPGRGLFHFNRMPFGLTNAPATWQRAIDNILGPSFESSVFVYLDDVIIVTKDYENHIKILKEVFERLDKAGLVISVDKCQLVRSELKYLGYVVNSQGLAVDPDKVSAILNIQSPRNVSEVRSILGMTSWYRRFIPNFSSIVAPLTNLLKKNVKFNWNDKCEKSFCTLKETLSSAPILTCPNFELPFSVQCDASGFGIGAVLTQHTSNGEQVICYLSRSLTRNERNYSTTERECLAVIWAVEKLRPYLEGAEFEVITDHYSLLWLSNLKDPRGRLARWALRLQQFNYTIRHRKGKDHLVPDALSRTVPFIDCVNSNAVQYDDPWYDKLKTKILDNPRKYASWKVIGQQIYKYVKNKYPELSDESEAWKKVIPKSLRPKILYECHDSTVSGHLGILKTYKRACLHYYWPKMKYDITKYVNKCTVCLASKPVQKKTCGLMRSHPKVSRPWVMISTDLIGPLPRSSSGHRFLLVISDYFSKYSLLYPLRTATASKVTEILEKEIFLVYGVPKFILVDNGVQYKSKQFRKMVDGYGSKVIYNCYFHPQANPCERVNKVIKTMLISYIKNNDQKKWNANLSQIGCALRTCYHEVTGVSPYFANFGREMILNPEYHDKLDVNNLDFDYSKLLPRSEAMQKLFADIKDRLMKAYTKQSFYYNLRRRDLQFNPGEYVWRKNFVLSDASKHFSSRLAPKYIGPFKIKTKVSYDVYELEDNSGKSLGRWHIKDLKRHPVD